METLNIYVFIAMATASIIGADNASLWFANLIGLVWLGIALYSYLKFRKRKR